MPDTDDSSPEPTALRSARLLAGLTLEQAAFAIGLESSAALSRWETRARMPTLASAFLLARFYGASPEQLFPRQWDRAALRLRRTADGPPRRQRAS